MARIKDIVGQRFGKLLVISYSHTNSFNRAVWLCQCDCGSTTLITTDHIKSGNTKSCGCLKEGKLENQKFNKLTAISKVDVPSKNGNLWLCICECGKETKVRTGNLLSGRVKSCGCLRTDLWYQQHEGITTAFFNTIKRNAILRKKEFNLTIEYVWNLFISQNKKCALSGMELIIGSMYRKIETTASLDRIDSSKGYVEGNVQWVHKDVNRMKMDLDERYFIELCKKISESK